jgi:hypothetical protein
MMATLVQELRNEEQFVADFANGVVGGQASQEGTRVCDFLSVVLLGFFWVFGFVAYSYVHVRVLEYSYLTDTVQASECWRTCFPFSLNT